MIISNAPLPEVLYPCANPMCAGTVFLASELQWWNGSAKFPAGWYCLVGDQPCMLLCLNAAVKDASDKIALAFRDLAKTASEAWVAALALSDLPKTVRAVCVAAAKWRKRIAAPRGRSKRIASPRWRKKHMARRSGRMATGNE